MKDVIYLTVNQKGVQRMTKNLPNLYRGEIPVKLTINVPPEAFNPPTLDQEIWIDDWRQGIDLEDIEFRQSVITKEEAEQIRQTRLAKMRDILERQGYKIEEPEDNNGAG